MSTSNNLIERQNDFIIELLQGNEVIYNCVSYIMNNYYSYIELRIDDKYGVSYMKFNNIGELATYICNKVVF